MEMDKIYNEDCLDTMYRMPDRYIDLVITSPPYDQLRDYKGYTFDFEAIAKELYRVSKDGGVTVWVVRDAVVDGDRTLSSFKQCIWFQDIGFKVFDVIIYSKPSGGIPNSRRYRDCFEYMFILTKGRPRTVNLIRDRKNLWWGTRPGSRDIREKDGSLTKGESVQVLRFGDRYNIWEYVTGHGREDQIASQHPAIFPEKLVRDHLISWSNPGDLVYDPFMGSGTVAKVAILNDRKYIGSEVSREYCDLSARRLKNVQFQESLFNIEVL